MGLELRNVQRYAQRVDEGTGQKYTVLVKNNPYLRLNSGDGPPIFIQGGKAYAEGGDEYELDDLPPWFMVLAKGVGETVAEQCGLDKLLQEIDEASGDEVPGLMPKPEGKPEPKPTTLQEITAAGNDDGSAATAKPAKPKVRPKTEKTAKGQFKKSSKTKPIAKKE